MTLNDLLSLAADSDDHVLAAAVVAYADELHPPIPPTLGEFWDLYAVHDAIEVDHA